MLSAPLSLCPYRQLQRLYLSASHGCMLHYVLLLLTGYDNIQGPILSAHKKLVAEKPTEEETEHKVKGQAKKEKHMAKEKGHAKPDSVLDKTERLRLVEDHLCYFTCVYLVEMGKKEMVSSFDMPDVPTGQLPEYKMMFGMSEVLVYKLDVSCEKGGHFQFGITSSQVLGFNGSRNLR